MKKQKKTCILIIPLCLFLFTGAISCSLYAQPVSQTFNTSGTYTVPAGYSANVIIEAWGGGGGGGSQTNGAKGSGGGGGYASTSVLLTAGNYTITVGAGGGAGIAGGNSSFTTLVIAQGGQSTANGNGGAGGTVAGSTGTIRIAGGGGNNAAGNNGGVGGNGANGGGAGGNGGAANNGSATGGAAPGGGGGGKAGPGGGGLSGAGGNGRVVVTVNTVLPVKITGLKAFEKQQGIQLEWTAFGETDMDKYQVEYSSDGMQFRVIGELSATNSAIEKKYSFFHANPQRGLNLYRLRAVSLNGSAEQTEVMRVYLGQTARILSLYPNPATGTSVSFSGSALDKGIYTIRLLNSTGQALQQQTFLHEGGALTKSIALPPDVIPGMYVIQLSSERYKGNTLLLMVAK